jgi:murein DD-endopeptidase MepM/ murein hydrolase activator NlpD
MNNLLSSRTFALVSWIITLLLVASMGIYTYLRLSTPAQAGASAAPLIEFPTAIPESIAQLPQAVNDQAYDAILREPALKTIIPQRPRYRVIQHTVVRGDSIFGISGGYGIKPETLLWANFDVLKDDPHGLRPGQVLNIPATDGVYYRWKEGDTLEGVAGELKVSPQDIIEWPGNEVDLANPNFEAGTLVMVPGGKREFRVQLLPTITRSSSTSGGASSCATGGGTVGSGFFSWPSPYRYLSGNDFYGGHPALDIAAPEGTPIFAADSGVVTLAASGWNYGYGNLVMIDHGNGYVTVYAHLSNFTVGCGQSVGRGQGIGLSGNTGNSFGAHLHFEVRYGGAHINPWDVLP